MLAPESEVLEYKQEFTRSFLKTVSAFGNFHDGDIIFGVTDDLRVIGVKDPHAFAESIAHVINDSLSPVPPYDISVNGENDTVTLQVRKGTQAPYFYKGKAYERRGSSTLEMDRSALQDLILESRNLTWDQLPSDKTELTFTALEKGARDTFGLEKLGTDALRSLGLINDSIYNRAAELLSDHNSYPGIDLAVFGDTADMIRVRRDFSGKSILEQYWQALEVFRTQYTYETIEGSLRKKTERIPETAFREALVNALIHRNWALSDPVTVYMYPDKIRITSPGGLPGNITEAEYLEDQISAPRNQTLAWIFFRLHLIERLGTGIGRIKSSYSSFAKQPDFQLAAHRISIVLPVTDTVTPLSVDDWHALDKLVPGILYTRQELEERLSLSKTRTLNLIKRLCAAGNLQKTGSGRSIRYYRPSGR